MAVAVPLHKPKQVGSVADIVTGHWANSANVENERPKESKVFFMGWFLFISKDKRRRRKVALIQYLW